MEKIGWRRRKFAKKAHNPHCLRCGKEESFHGQRLAVGRVARGGSFLAGGGERCLAYGQCGGGDFQQLVGNAGLSKFVVFQGEVFD